MDSLCQEKWASDTIIETVNLSYDWRIENVNLSGKKIGEFMDSPKFFSLKADGYQWFLRLYPNGDKKESENHLSLYLNHKYENQNIDVQYNLNYINSKGEEVNILKAKCSFTKENTAWGCSLFLKHDNCKNIEKLIIRCNLTAGIKIKNYPIIRNANNTSTVEDDELNCQSRIHDELEVLLLNKDFTDVTLTASGKEFHAHKAILAARSPVFFAMFKNDMREKAENKIEFDFDSNVLNEMLQYIYTGKVVNIEKYSKNLLFLAEKYALDGLKVMCEKFICSTISANNVIEILILADQYNCEKIKIQAINFIMAHGKDIIEFKMLKDSNL